MDTTQTLANSKLHIQANQRSLLGGIVTGQIAGLIMAVVVMIVFTLFLGKNPLYPVQLIGSVFFGESALHGFHLGALLTGLIVHQLGPSLFWGIIFGLLVTKFSYGTKTAALWLGLVIGVVSMVDAYVFVPFVFKAMQGVDLWNREVPMFWDWAAHIVFGLSFVLYPTVLEKFLKE